MRRREGGLALEIDGTWASWRRPGQETTASVWDALALPLLLLSAIAAPRVLILGLGGGSAARVVRLLAPRARVVGVEIDARVIAAARQSFGISDLALEVVRADARHYLRDTRRRFDLILDDVFVGSGETPYKPEGFPSPSLEHAARCLVPGGVLVSNSIDEASAVLRSVRALFRSVLEVGVQGFDNRIFVGSSRGLNARALRGTVAAHPSLCEILPALRVRDRSATGRRR